MRKMVILVFLFLCKILYAEYAELNDLKIEYVYIEDSNIVITSVETTSNFDYNSRTKIEIPSQIDGNTVFALEDFEGYGCYISSENATSIAFPNTIKRLNCNFYTRNLEEISIPSSVISIGGFDAKGTRWWDKQKDGLVTLDGWVVGYKGPVDETSSRIDFNGGARGVADNLTLSLYYKAVSDLILPNGMIYIGPNSIDGIGQKLTIGSSIKILFPTADSFWFMAYDWWYFRYFEHGDGYIGDGYGNTPTCYIAPLGWYEEVNIGHGVTEILGDGIGASGSSSLKKITIGDGVEYLESFAFKDCTNLEEVTLGSNIKHLWYETFMNCEKLSRVTLGSAVEYIGEKVFRNCVSLKEISIPSGVTNINYDAFNGCSSLENIAIPNSVVNIGSGTFEGCASLKEVTIPNSVKHLGDYVFQGCVSLEEAYVENSNVADGMFDGCSALKKIYLSNNVTNIGVSAFAGCQSLTDIAIPNNVSSLGIDVFNSCFSLTNIVIGSGLSHLPDGAFSWCEALEEITIPSNVKSVGSNLFYGCISLTNVVLGSGISYIPNFAFGKCDRLTSMIIPDSVTSVGEMVFMDCTSLEKISIPVHLRSYVGALKFGNNAEIEIRGLKKDSVDGVNWIYYADDTSKEAEIYADYSYVDSMVGDVVIPVVIGGYAVKKISNQVFCQCENLTSVVISDGVVSLGTNDDYGVFEGCTSLTNVVLGSGISYLPDYAFYGCESLTSVTIPDSVTSVGEWVFAYCTSLEKISIPASLKSYADALKGGNNVEIVVRGEDEAEEVISRMPQTWFDEYPSLVAMAGGDYAVAARATAANGMKVWQCYIAGLNPTDETAKFTTKIEIDENGLPKVSWSPDLGDDRKYTKEGKTNLGDEAWAPADETLHRFFRVKVELK